MPSSRTSLSHRPANGQQHHDPEAAGQDQPPLREPQFGSWRPVAGTALDLAQQVSTLDHIGCIATDVRHGTHGHALPGEWRRSSARSLSRLVLRARLPQGFPSPYLKPSRCSFPAAAIHEPRLRLADAA